MRTVVRVFTVPLKNYLGFVGEGVVEGVLDRLLAASTHERLQRRAALRGWLVPALSVPVATGAYIKHASMGP